MGRATLTGDTIVIGSGMAGFCAALTLRARGKEVAILSKGIGATALSSGAWDFGPIRTGYSLPFSEVRKSLPWKIIYQHLLVDDLRVPDSGEVAETVEMIQTALSPDLPLSFRYDRPYCLPTTSGNWKWTFGAQEIHARADLSRWSGKRVGLVCSKQWRLPGFVLAKQLSEMSKEIGFPIEITPLEIALPGKGDWALPNFATRLLFDPELKTVFKEDICSASAKSDYAGILFPPIFLDLKYAEELASDLGLPVAECLATIEPIPGQRLHLAMEKGLERAGIPKHHSERIGVKKSPHEILALEIAEGKVFAGERYFLASGKFIGGGITVGYEEITESFFQLPVFRHRTAQPIQYRSQLPVLPDPRESQPLAELGLWLNEHWKPQDHNRQTVLQNVIACGSVIGGVDFARENLGLGFMAYSGRRCALRDA